MGDLLPTAFGAGLFSMLVALFTLSMNAILKTGNRADARSDAEIARLQEDLRVEREEVERMRAECDRRVKEKEEEVSHWRDRFLGLIQEINKLPGGTDDE